MPLRFHKQVVVGLLVILFLCFLPPTSAQAQREEGQVTIVFDFTHDQPFSPAKRNFTQAIDFFQNYPEYTVRILQDGVLTAENLSRSHILVIPNPGRNYSASEIDVISEYVADGGSLFLLSDYQIAERPFGNPVALNAILQGLPESRIQFTTLSTENETLGDAIIDPENSQLLSYNIQVNNTNINSYPSREIFSVGINSLLIAGGSLTTETPELIMSTGAQTSQSVTINGDILQNQPGWLAAFQIANSRIVLSTSTTMFTNTLCAATNATWFDSKDNTQLWSNIFRWMSIFLVEDPTPVMIFFVTLVLIAGIIVFGYSIWRKRRGL